MNIYRATHNFLNGITSGNYNADNLEAFVQFQKFLENYKEGETKKIALLFICLNPVYWSLIKDTIEGAKKFFLPGHDVHFYIWSDIIKPDGNWEIAKEDIRATYYSKVQGMQIPKEHVATLEARAENTLNRAKVSSEYIHQDKKVHLIPAEGRPWPAGTLYRFHLFLQQEEELKNYEYLYYADIDMRFVNVIGDEVLNDLVAAEHPMYSLKKQLIPPYEPNPHSKAYINRPGTVITENGKPRFKPFYFAGGFQGGKSERYLKAAKEIAEMIDWDENNLNYHAVWNDESYWNKYLFDNPPTTVLSPAFIYPDSLINEYYIPIWGTNYPPKLITLTKDWSISPLTPEELKNLKNQ